MTDQPKPRQGGKSASQVTPEAYPTSPAQQHLPSGDFSYILEIVMSMQTSMGKFSEAVDSLKSQSSRHTEKLEKIGKDVHAAKVVVSVVAALMVASITFVGWVAKAYLDYLASVSHKP